MPLAFGLRRLGEPVAAKEGIVHRPTLSSIRQIGQHLGRLVLDHLPDEPSPYNVCPPCAFAEQDRLFPPTTHPHRLKNEGTAATTQLLGFEVPIPPSSAVHLASTHPPPKAETNPLNGT